MAPVKMCDECEMLYCGAPDRCLRGLKECLNGRCKKTKPFATSKIGRIPRNVFNTFEFKDSKDPQGESLKYEAKCKKLTKDFKDNQAYTCPHHGCETRDQKHLKANLVDHLKSDCELSMLECTFCEHDYTRATFDDVSVHKCLANLKQHIILKKQQNKRYLFKKKFLPVSYEMDLDNGGWSHVRHVPKSRAWFKATDQLEGTDEYGDAADLEDEEWSVRYDDVHFNQFLFVTGDKKKWLIMGREAVLGAHYNN